MMLVALASHVSNNPSIREEISSDVDSILLTLLSLEVFYNLISLHRYPIDYKKKKERIVFA